ncbi:plastin-3-like [Zophobas morio]|uniref:plastin-3-like n=1 Tax=Zophobas morio TaxID=2755281 RepID=UPI0030830FDD
MDNQESREDCDTESKRLESDQIRSEVSAFSEHLNNLLKKDEDLRKLGYIPINHPEVELFTNSMDGILLCKLVNAVCPGKIKEKEIKLSVDKSRIKVPGSKDAWEIATMIDTAISAAKSMGCVVVNIGSSDIMEGNRTLILAVIWQLVRAHIMKSINLTSHPELIRLLKPNEKIDKLLKMREEDIIKRWFNYHLQKAQSSDENYIEPVQNFGKDLKDCTKWVALLKQVAPLESEEAGIDDVLEVADPHERAEAFLRVAETLNCRKFTTASDIVKGYERLNLAFTATIFNEYVGITLPSEAELLRLSEDLEELRVKNTKCSEMLSLVQQQTSSLEKEKEKLLASIKLFEARHKESEEAIINKENDITFLSNSRYKEIKELKEALSETTLKLEESMKAYEKVSLAHAEEKRELSQKEAKNKNRISTLEGQNFDIEASINNLIDIAEGKGSTIEEMKHELEEKNVELENKHQLVSDYYQHAKDVLEKFSRDFSFESFSFDKTSSEKELLDNLLEGNQFVIEQCEDLLLRKKREYNRIHEEQLQKLNELSASVAQFLGEGPSAAEDPMAQAKKLLELLTEKSRKCQAQLDLRLSTIEKKNKLNEVVSQKIVDLAQNKNKKKKWKKVK